MSTPADSPRPGAPTPLLAAPSSRTHRRVRRAAVRPLRHRLNGAGAGGAGRSGHELVVPTRQPRRVVIGA